MANSTKKSLLPEEFRISDTVRVSVEKCTGEPDIITVMSNHNYVFIQATDWESLKETVDKLIADDKDG